MKETAHHRAFIRYDGSLCYRSSAHKACLIPLCYGASPNKLARRHGWRIVKECLKAINVIKAAL